MRPTASSTAAANGVDATVPAPAPAPAGQRNPPARNLAPAPRTDHPGAMRLDSGGSAGAGKLTGTHYIAYLPLTWTATKPPQDPRANAQTYGYDYFLEYRAATGLEAWTDDRTYTDPQGVVRSTPSPVTHPVATHSPDTTIEK